VTGIVTFIIIMVAYISVGIGFYLSSSQNSPTSESVLFAAAWPVCVLSSLGIVLEQWADAPLRKRHRTDNMD
jgi:hypothetical protein